VHVEDERDAAGLAEPAIGETDAASLDELRLQRSDDYAGSLEFSSHLGIASVDDKDFVSLTPIPPRDGWS
jgi:hypothetical protein